MIPRVLDTLLIDRAITADIQKVFQLGGRKGVGYFPSQSTSHAKLCLLVLVVGFCFDEHQAKVFQSSD